MSMTNDKLGTDPDLSYQALYLHIPFCKQRCSYCDFYTNATTANSPELDLYIEQLIKEVRSAMRNGLLGNIKTIYIGGGTPSFLGSKRLVNLVYTLGLSINLAPDTEFTIEANPESLTMPMVGDLFALGVNRISMGIQSFVDKELSALGRIHNVRQAREAMAIAQSRFSNVSIDLMCGIPFQTVQSWQQSLKTAIELDIQHISIYPLTVEQGTPFFSAAENGELELANEDTQAQMMELAASMLASAGFQRYEVASYAKSGFKCRHNISYWTDKAYLGLGRGAASMHNNPDGSRNRTFNEQVLNLEGLDASDGSDISDGSDGSAGSETLTPAQAAAEDLMLGMRLVQGVSLEQVKQAGELLPTVSAVFTELLDLRLAKLSTDPAGKQYYAPTTKGWLLGNELYSRLWDLSYS